MSRKLLFFLIGSLLLVNYGYSAPTKSSEELENILTGFIQSIKIFAEILGEFVILHKKVVSNGERLLEKVLNDPKVLEVKTDAMEEELKILRDYVEKLKIEKDKLNEIDSKEDSKENSKEDSKEKKDDKSGEKNKKDSKVADTSIAYLTFEETINKYKQENLSSEEEIIANSLKENGLPAFEEDVETHFTKFMDKFKPELESFIEKLDSDESKNVVDWFSTFKAETDVKKQLKLFSDIFTDSDES